MSYDEIPDMTIMVGGDYFEDAFDETWGWDGHPRQQLTRQELPSFEDLG